MAGKGAEMGFKPRACSDSPQLRFPTQCKFLALKRFFGPVPSPSILSDETGKE